LYLLCLQFYISTCIFCGCKMQLHFFNISPVYLLMRCSTKFFYSEKQHFSRFTCILKSTRLVFTRVFIGKRDRRCKLRRAKIDSKRRTRYSVNRKRRERWWLKGGEIGSERPIIVLVTIEPSCLRATFIWIRWENRKVKIPLFRSAISPNGYEGWWGYHLLHTQEYLLRNGWKRS